MDTIFQKAKELSSIKFRLTLPKYERFLATTLLNTNDKHIGVYGSRGVGKTTLMLQVAKKLDYGIDEIIYVSYDHLLFSDVSMFEFTEYFHKYGGKCILIDEIHEAKNFEQELKSIYDFLDVRVIFSGSSAIKLTNASFARRYAMYRLPILSFREFCELRLDMELPSTSMENLLATHSDMAHTILKTIGDEKIFKLFSEYLEHGAYPFFLTSKESYTQKITDTINTILYTDIALLNRVPASNIEALKKLLLSICLSKPLELSMENLSKTIGISKATLYKYVDYLHRAELLRHVIYEGKRFKAMQKPDKLYLSNTNIFPAICNNSDKGTIRETFFASQVAFSHSIYYVNRGDFLVQEKYTFEIGGKNKSFKQIKDVENSFVVADDIEVGFGNRVPLWLLGFLY